MQCIPFQIQFTIVFYLQGIDVCPSIAQELLNIGCVVLHWTESTSSDMAEVHSISNFNSVELMSCIIYHNSRYLL